MQEANPYAAPQAQLEKRERLPQARLARRLSRLAAVILDSFIYGIASLPLFYGNGYDVLFGQAEEFTSDGLIGFGICALLWLALFGVNLWMLHQRGWTIGKRAARIRIVRANGDVASLGRIFLLRMLIPGALNYVPGFALVDALFIFAANRRCLHDYIAGTIVVDAQDVRRGRAGATSRRAGARAPRSEAGR